MMLSDGQPRRPEDRLLYRLAVVLTIVLTLGWLAGFGALLAALARRLL